MAVDAANRWTGWQLKPHSSDTPIHVYTCVIADNVFAVKSWCKNKFGFEDSVINKQFDIPEDFDYIN